MNTGAKWLRVYIGPTMSKGRLYKDGKYVGKIGGVRINEDIMSDSPNSINISLSLKSAPRFLGAEMQIEKNTIKNFSMFFKSRSSGSPFHLLI
jgi:hypothetical protein